MTIPPSNGNNTPPPEPPTPSSPVESNEIIVGYRNTTALDRNKRTHIVVGGGGSAGDAFLFQQAAASHGKRYGEVFPEDQVVIIVENYYSSNKEIQLLQNFGYTFIQGQGTLFEELKTYHKIASLNVYSHSSTDQAFDFFVGNPETSSLTSLFTNNSWAVFHGCNAGWELAPYLAARWKIPVAGALTSTNFEELHSSLKFYPNDPGLSPPGPIAVINKISFLNPQNCDGSGCLRMKPDNQPYDGLNGKFDFGLPYYKFFLYWPQQCQL